MLAGGPIGDWPVLSGGAVAATRGLPVCSDCACRDTPYSACFLSLSERSPRLTRVWRTADCHNDILRSRTGCCTRMEIPLSIRKTAANLIDRSGVRNYG